MIPSKSKPKLAVGVDAGSARTRCVICAVEDGRLRFLGAGTAASQGWQKGRLVDPKAVSSAISAAVKEAESRAKVLVESVVLGVGGVMVQASQGRGVYEFGRPREVTRNDMSYAVELASRVRLEDDRMLVHVFPQDFTVDGRAGFRNPEGIQCSRLEANVLLITTSEHEHDGLVSATHQAHLAVEDTVFEPVAAAYAAILPEERHRGAAIVDLGMHSTGVAIYDGDAAVGAASIPIAADHHTRDVVMGLNYYHGITISYESAEILKREYGCAMLGLTADNTLVDVPSSDGRSSREVSRRQLNEILEARSEELFSFVKHEIRQCGMDQALMEGVFLTGGGARLHGMLDMAERILNCHARFGLAVGIQDWPQNFQDPAWTTSAGLAMYSARLKLFKQHRRKPPGLLGILGI
jgi:cell division protein FtsA